MIHHGILHTIKKDRQDAGFIYPYYGRYSIAELTQSILSYLGVDTGRAKLPIRLVDKGPHPSRVLFFFIDGLGFSQLVELSRRVSFFKKTTQKLQVFPLTSVFPSTTPAALTTLHTGLTPQEHGLPEWVVYFEEVGSIIETFPFRQHMTEGRETLFASGGTPEMLYAGETVYEKLRARGVLPYVLTWADYAESAYSRMVQKGASVIAARDSQHFFSELKTLLESPRVPLYVFAYWSAVDSAGHAFGPGSVEQNAAIDEIAEKLEKILLRELRDDVARDTLLILSADHGQSGIQHEEILYLNDYLPLEENYARNRSDISVLPTGAPHNVFLHITPEKKLDTLYYLKNQLLGKAEVMLTDEAIEKGLFGLNEPLERFKKRIGDILILPYEGYHIWYRHSPGGHFSQRGIHGGLSEREMIVPLLVGRLSDAR
jgi:hypothetical protein